MQTLFLAYQSVHTILFYKQLYNHGTVIYLNFLNSQPFIVLQLFLSK